MSSVYVTRFLSVIFLRLLSRQTMLRRFLTVCSCPILLMNCSMLILLPEIFCVPDIVNPLSVSTRSSGKQKLTLDLRHVNSFIFKQKFKYEDLGVAIQIFDKSFHLFKFDLMSGFHHIEIFYVHQKFLMFQLCVLPFGLFSAPFVFTKIFKALLKSINQSINLYLTWSSTLS